MTASRQPLAVATAPGKLILLGEHAVVHGQPALAVPARSVGVTATVWPHGDALVVETQFPPESGRPARTVRLAEEDEACAMGAAVRATLESVRGPGSDLPRWRIALSSTVPVGSGMGSSAAVAVALVRAVGLAAGARLSDAAVAELALAAERRTHGTPSGIDNTVVALDCPLRFQGGRGVAVSVARELHVLIGDSGAMGLTRQMVAAVGARRASRRADTDALLLRIGELVDGAVTALAAGNGAELGRLMSANHELLAALGVSTPVLDRLVRAARRSGALGAKLSGAGGGGVMIALVESDVAQGVARALEDAGAARVLATSILAVP